MHEEHEAANLLASLLQSGQEGILKHLYQRSEGTGYPADALLLALVLLERPVELLDYLTSLWPLVVVTSIASMAALWALGVFSSRWRLAMRAATTKMKSLNPAAA